MEFDPKILVSARVVATSKKPHNDLGAEKCYCTLMITDDKGKDIAAVEASVAPWLYYLHPAIEEMFQDCESSYYGWHIQTVHALSKKGGSAVTYYNVLGLHGKSQPDDHEEKLIELGLGKSYPAGNGRKPKAMPGASSDGIPERQIDDFRELPPEEEA